MKSNTRQIFVYDNDEYADSPLYFLGLKDAFTSRFLNGPGICQLLYQLDEWYGNTEQKTKDWALEYQLWARMILSLNAPAIMINPRHLLIADVLDEIVEILGNRMGCDKEVCDVYKDMAHNVNRLSLAKPQDDASFAIQWAPVPDAALLLLLKNKSPTMADYAKIADALEADKDEQLVPLCIGAGSYRAYGFIRRDIADKVNAMNHGCAFQLAVSRILNEMKRSTAGGDYIFDGVRTKILGTKEQ